MGIFTRFTLRSLAKNRVRTAVTVAGIALATGLLTAVLASVTSLQAAMLDQYRLDDGVYQAELKGTSEGALSRLREQAGPRLDRLAVERDLGSVALPYDESYSWRVYLGLTTLPIEQEGTAHAAGDDRFEVKTTPKLVDGRWPEAAGEVVLPEFMRRQTYAAGEDSRIEGVVSGLEASDPIELGSTVRASIGRRMGTDSATGRSWAMAQDSGLILPELEVGGAAGAADGSLSESLVGASEARELTVVGFSNVNGYANSPVAYVSADEPDAESGSILNAFVSTTGFSSVGELSEVLDAVGADGDGVAYNTMMLYAQGLSDDRALWTTLYSIIFIIAGVVVVAAVSLISNAFTISVSERTRQFGLLSSLGASRAQLRRTVLVEAAVLGVVGVPLGVALGVGGAAVAFSLTGDGWAALVGTDFSIGLTVAPWAIAATVALSVVTLLLSAMIPALRAGRVSAVDAIRQVQDIRLPRGLARRFARRGRPMDDLTPDGRRPRGLAARVFGVPGFLARRTRTVSASKGRVAVASLAVSVVLLVSAGGLGQALTRLTEIAETTGAADLVCYLDDAEAQSSRYGNSFVLDSSEGVLERVRGLSAVDEASMVAPVYNRVVRLPEGSVDWDALDAAEVSYNRDANGLVASNLYLVDDATWGRLAAEAGVTGALADPSVLSVVAVNRVMGVSSGRYAQVAPYAKGSLAGRSVELPVYPEIEGLNVSGTLWGGPDEGYLVSYYDSQTGSEESFAISDLVTESIEAPVAAVADSLPEWFPVGTEQFDNGFPSLVAPASAAAALSAEGAENPLLHGFDSGSATLYMSTDDGTEALDQVQDLVLDEDGLVINGFNNLREVSRQNRAAARTFRVFLYCFTAITTAIAVANVFNTIASGLMLRTREFAVLRSTGMGERAFRRMILLECADYAVRGLVLGLAASVLVCLWLWQATSLSFVTGFSLPAEHVLASAGVVVGVLALSTVYALRRSHATSVVDALRSDAL